MLKLVFLIALTCSLEIHNINFKTATGKTVVFSENSLPQNTISSKLWAYVKFNNKPNKSDLELHGIYLGSNRLVFNNVYKLFLNRDQLNYLQQLENVLISIINPKDKVVDISKIANSTMLEISGYFENIEYPTSGFYQIIQSSKNSMIIETSDPIQSMEYLSTVDSVNLISPFTNPVPLNNFASGFSQDNHASLSTYSDGTPFLPRYFDSYGINGKGQNIAMMDSTPDHYHAFLYDSNKPQIEFNKIMTDHRKIAYFYNKYGDDEDYMIKVTQENAGHGPHVCGIALGVSEDPNSAINAYRGVATGSKLFYAGNFLSGTSTFIDDPDGLSNLIKLFKETNTRIFTNSWGGESMTSKHLEFEQMSRDLSDSLLVLFAAGNSGTNNKYYTVMYPASCKNILTIGSLRMLYNMTDVTFHLILSENETIHNIKGDAILYTKVITKEAYATLSIYDDYSHPNTTAKIILVNKDTLKNFLSPLKISNQKIDYEVLALLVDNYTQPIVTTADKMNLMDLIDFIKLDTFVIQDHNITNYIDKRIKLISNFTSIYSPIYKKSDSSSIGPTVTGLIKPDIVTPGQNIWSSSSMNVKQPNHGIDGNPSKNFSDLVKLSGTSMATPNAAGCAALIAQYFCDGFYFNQSIQPSGLLLKSMLILSTNLPNVSNYTPDVIFGFGVVDLSNVLRLGNSNFGLRITNYNMLNNNMKHLKGKVILNKKYNHSLKIVLCHNDEVLDQDSLIPIYNDLDLIVITPSKKVIYGNQRINNNNEHLTLNERIIIDENDIEDGEYEIHILSNFMPENTTINYVISLIGPFEHNNIETNPIYLELNPTNECININNDKGECDTNEGINKCNENYTGQLCQMEINEIINENSIYNYTITNQNFDYFKISKNKYQNLIATIYTPSSNNIYSMYWISDNQNSLTPSNALLGSYLSIKKWNLLPKWNGNETYYFTIQNNYNAPETFSIKYYHIPINDLPICLCKNYKCLIEDKCGVDNIYSEPNEISFYNENFDKTINYLIDYNITLSLELLQDVTKEVNIQSLNENVINELKLVAGYNEVEQKINIKNLNLNLIALEDNNVQINEMEVINSKFNVGENVKIDVQKLKLSAISSFNDINGKIDIDNIEINENGNYNVISENVSIKTNDKEISIQNFSYITTDLNKFKELNFNVQFGNMKISDSTASSEKFDLQFENSKMNNDQITIGKLEFNDFSSTSLHYIKEIASDSVSINDKSTSIRDISIADDSVMFSTSNSIKIEYPLTKISIVTLKSENEFELKSAANADALNLFVEYNEVKRKLTLNSSNIVLSSKGIKNIQINEMEVINSKFNVGENVKIDVQKLKLSAISSFNDINGKIDIDNIEINENGNYNVISENVSIKTNDKEISIQNFSYITTDLNKFKELNFNVQFGNMKISDSTASSEKFDLQFENSKMNNDQITIGKLEFNDFSSTSLHYIKEIASDSVSINDKSAAIDGISVSGDSILFNASSAIKFECPSSKVRSVAFLSGIGKQRAFSITVPDANVTVPKMSISFTNADGALVKCYGISTVEELNSLFQIDFANANNSEIQFGQSEPAPGGKWGLKTILCVAIPCAAAAIVAVVVVVVLVMKRRRSKGADERSMQTETLSLNLV